jgi:uncharacterized protein YjiS (DUF1127 family)
VIRWRHDVAFSQLLLREWYFRARSRRDIAKLDGNTIGDLGLCPSQMRFEADKPFWRA